MENIQNIRTIIQNWTTASEEEIQQVKNEVYKIIPSWKEKSQTDEEDLPIDETELPTDAEELPTDADAEKSKIGCVKALDNKYVFYKEYYILAGDIEECVVYDVTKGEFTKSDKFWKSYLPRWCFWSSNK
jgi:hypothetical protein